jgi:O-acetyl-ADP-ribose deacetylase (regulator of RNase III)
MSSSFELQRGNLLDADVEALVNTVNTVGVMGKGIALQFKKAYPHVYDAYRRACEAGEVEPGKVLVVQTGQLSGPRLVINFPTKRHWRGRSRMADIDAGLRDLVRVLREWEVKSVAVPPLGCGNGGLEWHTVRPRIEAALGTLPDLRVLLFEPAGAPAPQAQRVATERPRMTRGRAALVAVLDAYRTDPASRITLLVAQKLAYLLQVRGEPLRLTFTKGHYGPYSEAINHVLQRMEGHFISGYGDRTAEADIRVDADAAGAAAKYLEGVPETRACIIAIESLIEGFESPWGLELLTTVHWAAHHGEATDSKQAAAFVADWNPRKKRVFDERHVVAAWDRLSDHAWLPPGGEASSQAPS